MSTLEIEFEDGSFDTFSGELLEDEAPKSIETMREFLPLETEVMHVRWSGHATWINIDEIDLPDVPRENHTVYPSRGDILFYPGYRNEQEILIPCGSTCFKSPAGELAGNHVTTLDVADETLVELEQETLRNGLKEVTVRIVD
ncbi:hypothetical protein C482_02846 [Natrialba chahannaoensis JCM 10990]|uniref:Cyclophilin TM1367-like domain-containing protein n=1 Tax=Natrialba chahannaoensis JCM 10990 TaxID=1227492 RepID=M0B3F2_9EURY|nr:DUF3830 family protein [Natrialba chahannaoensis]ELZ05057.1 hypothetical protein C482_02846 [Natrialba chahannaoensis JCM 10990]